MEDFEEEPPGELNEEETMTINPLDPNDHYLQVPSNTSV